MSSSDSSFSSSFSSAFSSAAAGAPPAAAPPAAAAPPPLPPEGTDASFEEPSWINYCLLDLLLKSTVTVQPTSLMSLPLSSEISLSRRSSSASMPTDSRTLVTSDFEGLSLPARPRRRYAARCFILVCCSALGQYLPRTPALRTHISCEVRERERQSI